MAARLGELDHSYWVRREASGLGAAGRDGLRARFAAQGVTVSRREGSFGLRLSGVGFAGSLQAMRPVVPVVEANRVTYVRHGVREWYANGPLGLEQGFTVDRPSAPGRGPLTVALAVSGAGSGRLSDGARSLVLPQSGLAYRGLLATDARGRGLPAWLSLKGQRLEIRVDARSAAYPVRIDPFVQAAKLTASSGAANDTLGYSVAVSADGSTVVAGGYTAAVNGNAGQGAAWVFAKANAGWSSGTETAKLTASDGAANDLFGASVGVSADGSTVVVGAYQATVGANANQGAAYVFTRPAAGWSSETQTAKLTASDGATGASLGISTGMSSDGSTVVVGAFRANSSHGAAYVFRRTGTAWSSETEAAKLSASDGAASPYLGYSTAISGDGATVVAGSYGATVANQSSQGAAYVFTKSGSGWASGTEAAKLTALDGVANDQLGFSVGVSADGSTVVAGANQARVAGGNNAGAAYVFLQPGSGWASSTSTAKLTDSSGAPGGRLGQSIGISADGSTVAAGIPYAAGAQGAADVFLKPSSGWVFEHETARLTAADGVGSDQLGSSVGVSSDGLTVVTGAPEATVGANSRQGAAYVFLGGSSLASPTLSVSAPSGATAGTGIPASSVSATLSSGTSPTGTVTFKVFGPQSAAPSDCSGGTLVGTASLSGNGTYNPSSRFTPPQAGSYWWYASYDGDSGNNSAASPCGSQMVKTVVAPAPPQNTAPPVISGTPTEGRTLTTSDGTWSNTVTSYSYAWQRCGSDAACTAIGGATTRSYTLTAPDVGQTIRAVVTAHGPGGDPAATSRAVGPVASAPTVHAVAGGPYNGRAGQTIALDGSGSSSSDGGSITCAWDFNGNGLYTDATTCTPNYTVPAGAPAGRAYPISLRVSEPSTGQSATASTTVTVAATPTVHAVAGGPYTGRAGQTIALDGSGSSSSDGGSITCAWDFNGNGLYTDATTCTPNYTVPAGAPAGSTYPICLRVSEPSSAQSASACTTVSVTSTPQIIWPAASCSLPARKQSIRVLVREGAHYVCFLAKRLSASTPPGFTPARGVASITIVKAHDGASAQLARLLGYQVDVLIDTGTPVSITARGELTAVHSASSDADAFAVKYTAIRSAVRGTSGLRLALPSAPAPDGPSGGPPTAVPFSELCPLEAKRAYLRLLVPNAKGACFYARASEGTLGDLGDSLVQPKGGGGLFYTAYVVLSRSDADRLAHQRVERLIMSMGGLPGTPSEAEVTLSGVTLLRHPSSPPAPAAPRGFAVVGFRYTSIERRFIGPNG